MRHEVFIAPTSDNFSQQIQGAQVSDQGDVEPPLQDFDIELKRQAFGSTAQVGVVWRQT